MAGDKEDPWTLTTPAGGSQFQAWRDESADPPNWPGLIRWMAIGAAQASVFGLLAAFQWLRGAPHRAFALDRSLRGLGKVFFGGPFALKFYGRSAAS